MPELILQGLFLPGCSQRGGGMVGKWWGGGGEEGANLLGLASSAI